MARRFHTKGLTLATFQAIFYAINNGRDDVVRLLLKWDANLLIRNRKGHNPCTMAEGRVEPGTLELLRQREQEQLQKGGAWIDYSIEEQTNGNQSTVTKRLVEQSEKADNDAGETPAESDTARLKRLSKKLRDSAGKRGKFDVVCNIVEEAGDDFPEVSILYLPFQRYEMLI